ncbi:hypothetical protein MA16_Dca000566 [Dendrobium catenatum]|uniref:Uncharacterized protein n=1 Tax=Dendrobium catenatum TaxID=906689 RepID=A0A2I0WU79_9ASPA|nr:hypothetical protein MA16_Dca000566 [Dendrobium catenatum]
MPCTHMRLDIGDFADEGKAGKTIANESSEVISNFFGGILGLLRCEKQVNSCCRSQEKMSISLFCSDARKKPGEDVCPDTRSDDSIGSSFQFPYSTRIRRDDLLGYLGRADSSKKS